MTNRYTFIIFDSKIRSILVVVFLYLTLHKECDLNLIGIIVKQHLFWKLYITLHT